jgi:predicted ATP-dependent protease
MVNNFKDEFRPKAIPVPDGKANLLSKNMDRVVEDVKKKLPGALGDESFLQSQNEIKNRYTEKKQALFKKLEKVAEEKNLKINKTATGLQPVPIFDGKPLTPDDFENLPEDAQRKVEENMRAMREETEAMVREVQKIDLDMQSELGKLVEQVATSVVKDCLAILREHFFESKEIIAYLYDVQAHIVENVKDFIAPQESTEQKKTDPFQPPKSPTQRYIVNVLVDRRSLEGAPVVFETNPTYQNVFGQIEKRAFMGTLMTDFTLVKAGSLLEANGGFLVMEVEPVLRNPHVWEALKRALETKKLYIEDFPSTMGFGTASLRPEPIPLDVKIILLGEYYPFQILQNYDSKFNKIFKVRADFDHEVERNDHTIQQYARYISRACKEEQLLPFTPDGVATVEEFGKMFVSNKEKLSLRFGQIMGVLKEADYWARKDNQTKITDCYVIKAFNEQRLRQNLYEEKIHENYVDNTIMINVTGEVVGQVNALSVYKVGDFMFGRPSRITAETYMGKKGIINIEREAKLSGKTHDKGVLILSGYLGRTFAQNHPLTLSTSITFEQSYGEIEGDSASSTELYAVLSSLSQIPIKQGIAVTGSVNQKGEIQAIGGVNQKIEGFFDVCKAKGLTGSQGVMVPKANVKNLMLKREVIEAVEAGQFHVYSVSTVEEGIELLTGLPAGTPDKDGSYPGGTVYGEVQKKLQHYWERSEQLKKDLEEIKEEM